MTNPTDDRPGASHSQSGTSNQNHGQENGQNRGQENASDDRAHREDRESRDSRESDSGTREERHARRRARHDQRRRERHGRHGRKERVLHTRISEQLSDDIRRLAEDLRVPTSNLVRNVLEEVFTVVETVSDDVGDLLDDVLEEAGSARERVRHRSRHRGRSHGARGSSWADAAEAEIRRDESAEARSDARSRPAAAAEEAEDARRTEQSRPPRPDFEEVIGWQPLVLNKTQDCASCGYTIRRGSRAFVGQTENGLSRIALCRQCLADR